MLLYSIIPRAPGPALSTHRIVLAAVKDGDRIRDLNVTTDPALTASLCRSDSGQAENLAQDMADLMHDFDAVSR